MDEFLCLRHLYLCGRVYAGNRRLKVSREQTKVPVAGVNHGGDPARGDFERSKRKGRAVDVRVNVREVKVRGTQIRPDEQRVSIGQPEYGNVISRERQVAARVHGDQI